MNKKMLKKCIRHIVVAKRFIRTPKNKTYKCMTLISKNVYIDKLDDLVKKIYNNTYYSTINMKPVDVKSSTYISFSKEINDVKFKISDIVKISKYKPFLQKAIF